MLEDDAAANLQMRQRSLRTRERPLQIDVDHGAKPFGDRLLGEEMKLPRRC
jgi:hypothetical protein